MMLTSPLFVCVFVYICVCRVRFPISVYVIIEAVTPPTLMKAIIKYVQKVLEDIL